MGHSSGRWGYCLLGVQIDDAIKANLVFEMPISDEVEPRRGHIEANALSAASIDMKFHMAMIQATGFVW